MVARPGAAHGLLLAAVACETQAKAILRGVASDEVAPLLEFMLNNPRTSPFAAAQLFDGVADAVVGRSLRRENKELWKRVDQLFQARNRVAHRADLPEVADARAHLAAAIEAIKWLAAAGGRGE